MDNYTSEQADHDAKLIYATREGKRFFNHLLDAAGVGKRIYSNDSNGEQKRIGAHNFAVDEIADRLARKPKTKGK